ncbi:MAG TPA: CotH kinase family protein, partial [Verrucomicrobiae bacterium]|nr:CotH kinase family protein [Verrucomicrobiae bacterium]
MPGTLHTSFSLRAGDAESGGEYLALVDPQGNVVSEFSPVYPEQFTDISYGRDRGNPDLLGYFTTPTPGEPNVPGGAGFSSAVEFSQVSKTFPAGTSFTVALSTPSPTAVIRYTTTTNVPSETSPIYSSPIPVNGTAMIRARAFQPGLLPGPLRTEHYIALDAAVLDRDSDLPLIIMHTYGGGTANQTADKFVVMQVFERQFGRAALTNPPTQTVRGRFKIRGSSTAGYAKQSWAYEAWDEFDDDKEIELLGMPEDPDWVFYAPNNFEPALIHNPLAHELSRQIGRYGVRTRFAEVYYVDDSTTLNPVRAADYNGIYVVSEKIKRDPNRVAIDNLQPEHLSPPEITGGYLLKIDRADPGDTGFPVAGSSGVGGQTVLY